MNQTTPRPDVPDDLVAAAADAIRRYDWDTGVSANPDIGKHQRGEAAAVLAAVLPAHERQVRERVAAELLGGFGDLDPADDYDQGVMDAAKKALVES